MGDPIEPGDDCARSAAAYARAYLGFALVAILILARIVPPYQAPDEPEHFKRADQVSRGVLIAHRVGAAGAGGIVSTGIGATAAYFDKLPFHPDITATPLMYGEAWTITWANSAVADADFFNTAVYPPFLYLPSVAGIWVGKLAGLSVITTLDVSRAAMGIASICVAALAIALAGGAAPWLFALLSLPMSLSLMASVSQDGPLIAFAALAAAIFIRLSRNDDAETPLRLFVTMCVSIGLIALARPVYVVFCVLPLLAVRHRWTVRVAGAAAIVVSVGLWMLLVAPIAPFALGADANAPAQIAFILAHPGTALSTLIHTLSGSASGYYLEMFVGRLGWLDTALPASFHRLAWIVLVVAAVATAAGLRARAPRLAVVTIVGAILAAFAALLLVEYVAWTKPDMEIIQGMQGRYLIPLALFAAAALPALGRRPGAQRIARALFWLLWLFPPISIAVTIFTVIRRYYL